MVYHDVILFSVFITMISLFTLNEFINDFYNIKKAYRLVIGYTRRFYYSEKDFVKFQLEFDNLIKDLKINQENVYSFGSKYDFLLDNVGIIVYLNSERRRRYKTYKYYLLNGYRDVLPIYREYKSHLDRISSAREEAKIISIAQKALDEELDYFCTNNSSKIL